MMLLETVARAKLAFVEQRRSFRHATNCPAWIEIGDQTQTRSCTIVNASAYGVRIMVASPNDLPEEFSLVLAFRGQNITRRVRIVWSSDEEVGVRYLGPAI